MAEAADPRFLDQQYRTADHLQARIDLHVRFSTASTPWMTWLFDQLELPAQASILELGCGTGDLWARNRERIPAGWQITLSDRSPGMLAAARAQLGERCTYAEIDAHALPWPNASADAIVANFMLYHVADRPQALAEIRRVLRPGGRLYAATVGQHHLRELQALAQQPGEPPAPWLTQPFTLQNGAAQLAPFFAEIDLRHYADSLRVTEVEPIVAHIVSGRPEIQPAALAAIRAELAERLASSGVIEITKESGTFVCRRGD